MGRDGCARRLERSRAWLKDLRAIDRAKLSAASKVDYDVVVYQQDQSVGGANPYTPFGTDPYDPFGVWTP